MSYPQRGEVWEADLNPTIGTEQGKVRPVLVLSVDQFNRTEAELIVVLPITSRFKGFSTHIEVKVPEGGLSKDSFIMCEQLRTISHERLTKPWGKVSFKTMQQVSRIIRAILGF